MNIKILDGGMSTYLIEHFGHKKNEFHPLWGSQLVLTHPNHIIDAHKNYLEAGSNIIETVTYQASVEGFVNHLKLTVSQANEAIDSLVECANEALRSSPTESSVKIAGSLGCYGAQLANGSEYSPSYVDQMSTQELKIKHKPQVNLLANNNLVDFLAFETLSTLKETEAFFQLMREHPFKKFWVSFSCKNSLLTWHDENLTQIIETIFTKFVSSREELFGVGVNCTAPWLVGSLVDSLAHSLANHGLEDRLSLLFYPNKDIPQLSDNHKTKNIGKDWSRYFEHYVQTYKKNIISNDLYAKHTSENDSKGSGKKFGEANERGSGFLILGGCCGSTPKDISSIAKILNNKN